MKSFSNKNIPVCLCLLTKFVGTCSKSIQLPPFGCLMFECTVHVHYMYMYVTNGEGGGGGQWWEVEGEGGSRTKVNSPLGHVPYSYASVFWVACNTQTLLLCTYMYIIAGLLFRFMGDTVFLMELIFAIQTNKMTSVGFKAPCQPSSFVSTLGEGASCCMWI